MGPVLHRRVSKQQLENWDNGKGDVAAVVAIRNKHEKQTHQDIAWADKSN